MLKNILDSVESWEGFKTWTDPIQLRWKLQDIKVKYTDDTQIEDDIGVQSEEQADIVEEIEGEKEDSCTKRKLSSWSADRTVKRLKFTYENCNVLDTNSGIINANVIENKKNLDFTNSSRKLRPTSIIQKIGSGILSDRKNKKLWVFIKGSFIKKNVP